MKPGPLEWLLLIICALIWGSSFILIKTGLIAFSFDQVAALRLSMASLVLMPIALWNIRKLKRADLKYIAVVSFIGNGIPLFLYPLAQKHIESNLAGMLNSLTPLFILIFGILYFGQIANRWQWAGILTGLLGAFFLVWFSAHDDKPDADNRYAILCVLSTLCYGFSGNVIKRNLQNIRADLVIAWAFMLSGPFLAAYLFTTDFTVRLTHPEAVNSMLALVVLAVMGTVVGSIIYILLIQRTNAVFGSLTTYLMPAISLVWGWVYAEPFTYWYIIGLLLILSGVYLTSLGNRVKVD